MFNFLLVQQLVDELLLNTLGEYLKCYFYYQ